MQRTLRLFCGSYIIWLDPICSPKLPFAGSSQKWEHRANPSKSLMHASLGGFPTNKDCTGIHNMRYPYHELLGKSPCRHASHQGSHRRPCNLSMVPLRTRSLSEKANARLVAPVAAHRRKNQIFPQQRKLGVFSHSKGPGAGRSSQNPDCQSFQVPRNGSKKGSQARFPSKVPKGFQARFPSKVPKQGSRFPKARFLSKVPKKGSQAKFPSKVP